jgi:tol-pal system protein YbgF
MRNRFVSLVFVAALVLATVPSASAASKEIVQLQTMVQNLQDQLQHMQQSIDERMGVMKDLVQQSTDNVNKMGVALNTLQNTLNQQIQQQSKDSGAKVDQVSAQIQALNDSVDELKARLTRVTAQLDDIAKQQQNIPAQQPMSVPGGGSVTTPQAAQQQPIQAPPPDVLYNNALSDYNGAKYNLAMQEFADYIKFYGNTDLAGNAQYYIADIEYRQGNYQQAVQDYDKVLEQYPSGNKASAAQLKKAYALINIDQRDAGIRELRALIARYPRSLEAQQARDRLRSLGASTTASKPSPTRR